MGVWDDDRKMTDESKDAEIYIYTCVQHILPPKKSIRYMQSKSDELEWEKRKESFFFHFKSYFDGTGNFCCSDIR